jgi:hypothetical protein
MRTVKYSLTAVLALGLLAGLGVYQAAYDDKPKYTIEQIMEKAHKKAEGEKASLFKKVVDGKADKEQTQELATLYQELAKNKPPKGDLGDWKKRTGAMVTAAKDVAEGKEGSNKALAKAVKCMECHELHKSEE